MPLYGTPNVLVFAPGSAAAPSVAVREVGTGMWSPAVAELAFSTGGTERVRIDAAGNVAVNGAANLSGYGANARVVTVNAATGGQAVVELARGGTLYGRLFEDGAGNVMLTSTAGSSLRLRTSTAIDLLFEINSVEAGRFNGSGNFFLGSSTMTGNPRLGVQGAASQPTAVLRNAASTPGDLLQLVANGGGVLSRFDSGGWLGLGTTPGHPLSVQGDASVGTTVSIVHTNPNGGSGLAVTSTDTDGGAYALGFTSTGAPELVLSNPSGQAGYIRQRFAGANVLQIGRTFPGGDNLSAVSNFGIWVDADNDGTGVFAVSKGSWNGRVGSDGTELFRIANDGAAALGTSTTSFKFTVSGSKNSAALAVTGLSLDNDIAYYCAGVIAGSALT